MDSDGDWTTTGLFSPSKAKAYQAQAKDWAFVDSWLTKRSASKRLPDFERNEDTLQALLALATVNDAADELRGSIDRVEKAALTVLSKRAETSSDNLHELILRNLESKSGLDTLANLAILSNASHPSALAIGTAIAEMNDAKFAQDQQIQRTSYQLQALRAEQNRVEGILASLQSDGWQASADIQEQTAEWTRSSKQLRTKVGEYDDRLAGSRTKHRPSVTFDDMAKTTSDLVQQHSLLERLEHELEAFKSLPSDANGARSKLEAAREELRDLTKERDALFENMAGV